MKQLTVLIMVAVFVLSVGVSLAQDEPVQTATIQARYFYALDQHQDYLEFQFQISKGDGWQGISYGLPPLTSDLKMRSDYLMVIWIDGELIGSGNEIIIPKSDSERWMEIRVYNSSTPTSHITGEFNGLIGHLYLMNDSYYNDLTVVIGGYNGQWQYRYQGDATVRVSVVNLVVDESIEFQYWKTVTDQWPDLYTRQYSWPVTQPLIHQKEWLSGGYMAFQVIFPE